MVFRRENPHFWHLHTPRYTILVTMEDRLEGVTSNTLYNIQSVTE